MEEKNNPIIGFIPEYLTIFVEHIEKHESVVCVFWANLRNLFCKNKLAFSSYSVSNYGI